MMEQLTSADFAARRWKMHGAVAAAAASGWKEFDNSLEDFFESRAFAYQDELIARWSCPEPSTTSWSETLCSSSSPARECVPAVGRSPD